MRIAQVAPLAEAVPPRLYGGTERVVHWLTEELVTLGHEITLFASGDSRTSAKLDATWPRALRRAARRSGPSTASAAFCASSSTAPCGRGSSPAKAWKPRSATSATSESRATIEPRARAAPGPVVLRDLI